MKFQEMAKLKREYDRLSVEERLHRMEYLAQYYCELVSSGGSPIVDATKYWPQFEQMKKLDEMPDLGTVTLGDLVDVRL